MELFTSATTPNGNSSFSYHSQEEADQNAQRLDMNGNFNCIMCASCVDCSNCRHCAMCRECEHCELCTDCVRCVDCAMLEMCTGCFKLTHHSSEFSIVGVEEQTTW